MAADADVQVTGQVARVEGDRLRREALIRGQSAQRLALRGRVDRPEAGVAVPVRVDVVAVDVVRIDVVRIDVVGVDVIGVDVVGVDVIRDERARVDVVGVDVVAVDVVGVDVVRRDVSGRVLPDLRERVRVLAHRSGDHPDVAVQGQALVRAQVREVDLHVHLRADRDAVPGRLVRLADPVVYADAVREQQCAHPGVVLMIRKSGARSLRRRELRRVVQVIRLRRSDEQCPCFQRGDECGHVGVGAPGRVLPMPCRIHTNAREVHRALVLRIGIDLHVRTHGAGALDQEPAVREGHCGHGGRRDAVIRTGAEVDTLPDVVRDRARAHEVTVDRFVGLAAPQEDPRAAVVANRVPGEAVAHVRAIREAYEDAIDLVGVDDVVLERAVVSRAEQPPAIAAEDVALHREVVGAEADPAQHVVARGVRPHGCAVARNEYPVAAIGNARLTSEIGAHEVFCDRHAWGARPDPDAVITVARDEVSADVKDTNRVRAPAGHDDSVVVGQRGGAGRVRPDLVVVDGVVRPTEDLDAEGLVRGDDVVLDDVVRGFESDPVLGVPVPGAARVVEPDVVVLDERAVGAAQDVDAEAGVRRDEVAIGELRSADRVLGRVAERDPVAAVRARDLARVVEPDDVAGDEVAAAGTEHDPVAAEVLDDEPAEGAPAGCDLDETVRSRTGQRAVDDDLALALRRPVDDHSILDRRELRCRLDHRWGDPPACADAEGDRVDPRAQTGLDERAPQRAGVPVALRRVRGAVDDVRRGVCDPWGKEREQHRGRDDRGDEHASAMPSSHPVPVSCVPTRRPDHRQNAG